MFSSWFVSWIISIDESKYAHAFRLIFCVACTKPVERVWHDGTWMTGRENNCGRLDLLFHWHFFFFSCSLLDIEIFIRRKPASALLQMSILFKFSSLSFSLFVFFSPFFFSLFPIVFSSSVETVYAHPWHGDDCLPLCIHPGDLVLDCISFSPKP